MALPHARPLDVINAGPLGSALSHSVSTSLLKTETLQLLHLVLPQHADQPEHFVENECVIHCLEGDLEVVMPGGARRLRAGHLVVLPAKQKHSLRARSDCAVLVTLLLRNGDAGDGGGTGNQRLAPEPESP